MAGKDNFSDEDDMLEEGEDEMEEGELEMEEGESELSASSSDSVPFAGVNSNDGDSDDEEVKRNK